MKIALLLLAMARPQFAQVKLPPYTRDVLPNGVTVLLMPRSGTPLVHFRVLIRGGVESDPASLAGLANVTAQLLRKGTAKRTADQFSQELDFLGGTFFTNFDATRGSAAAVTGEFLKKDFDRGLDLISDAILHPTFPETEAKKELALRIDTARAIKDNPQAAINFYFQAAYFGKEHPYGHPADEVTLARITRAEIADYHEKIYCGRNIIVIITGDFDAASARAKVARVFDTAPAGTSFAFADAPANAHKGHVVLIDKPDATQTYFIIAQSGIDRKNPDHVKLELINTLFGGRFTSMLNEALRVDSGLTYGAASVMDESRLPGALFITTYTKTDSTARAIHMALDVLARMNEKGITADQLASVKAYVKGTFPTFRLETMDQLAAMLGNIELYGLGRDSVDEFSRVSTQ